MSADLHIHIAKGITEEDFKCFFGHTLGTKWFNMNYECEEEKKKNEIYEKYLDQLYSEFPDWIYRKLEPEEYKTDPHEKRWNELYDLYLKETGGRMCSHWEHIENSPNIWIGEVSWLKAALFEDQETYVPDLISEIWELCEPEPVIDEKFLNSVEAIFDNTTNSTQYSLTRKEEVINFLKNYMGEKVFTVSW